MVSVVWITLFGVLSAGYLCLRSCRLILRSGTTGNVRREAVGLLPMVHTLPANLRKSLSVELARSYGLRDTNEVLKRMAHSPGSRTERLRYLDFTETSDAGVVHLWPVPSTRTAERSV